MVKLLIGHGNAAGNMLFKQFFGVHGLKVSGENKAFAPHILCSCPGGRHGLPVSSPEKKVMTSPIASTPPQELQ